MAKKVESYQSNSGRLFLTEENAVRHDAMERLCEIMPEFQMIRTRLEGNLDAMVSALAPMVDLKRRKTTPETTPETTLKPPVAVDHGELAGTCDCSASMSGNGGPHHPTCPSYRPVARRCPYNHPDDTRCPNCNDWENYVHRQPVRAVNG